MGRMDSGRKPGGRFARKCAETATIAQVTSMWQNVAKINENFFFLVGWFFQTGFPCIAVAVLELTL